MVDALAEEYGFELRRCLTGFKYIGDIITSLSDAGEVDRFIFGFEESYGYLAGDHVRDKDAVSTSLLICQMAQYYKLQGKNLADAMHELYEKYGYYHNKTISLSYPGAEGAAKMAGIMAGLRENPPAELAGSKIEAVVDYNTCVNGLPKANVIEFDPRVATRVSSVLPAPSPRSSCISLPRARMPPKLMQHLTRLKSPVASCWHKVFKSLLL